jgi:hypothetical protein
VVRVAQRPGERQFDGRGVLADGVVVPEVDQPPAHDRVEVAVLGEHRPDVVDPGGACRRRVGVPDVQDDEVEAVLLLGRLPVEGVGDHVHLAVEVAAGAVPGRAR